MGGGGGHCTACCVDICFVRALPLGCCLGLVSLIAYMVVSVYSPSVTCENIAVVCHYLYVNLSKLDSHYCHLTHTHSHLHTRTLHTLTHICMLICTLTHTYVTHSLNTHTHTHSHMHAHNYTHTHTYVTHFLNTHTCTSHTHRCSF